MKETSKQCRTRWNKSASTILTGRKIKSVRYLNDAEVEDMGWYESCLAIFLDDGTIIFPSSDDEGNSAGALFTTNKLLETIPTISM